MLSLEVFKSTDSARLLSGQLLSQLCDKMMSLGLVWVICAEKSAAWVPWFLAVGALPHLLLSWKAGSWTSKLGPLRTVIRTDVLRGAIFLASGLIWLGIPARGQMPALFAITFAANAAAALFNPAILSLPSQLCEGQQERIQKLTAAIDSSFSLSNVLGPACVALLYPWCGLRGLFLLTGASYLAAAFLCSAIRGLRPEQAPSPGPQKPAQESPLGSIALLRGDSLVLFLLAAFFMMNLVLTPLIAFLPLFAKSQLHGQIGTLAGLEMAIGIGTVVGGVALSMLHLDLKTWPRVIAGLAVTSLMYLSFSINQRTALACVFLAILGVALSLVNISLLSFFQTRPAPKDVPVVMSLVNLISVGALPFSMLIVGALLARVDLHGLAIVLSLLLAAITAATAFHREFRTV